jgi:hypothetical protein
MSYKDAMGVLPEPVDDVDTGYGDEEELKEVATNIDPKRVFGAIQQVLTDQQAQQDQCSAGPQSGEDFGEVSDPDEDSYPEPENFFGPDKDD